MFRGELVSTQIFVKNLSLFDYGQFGKGSLSRTKPIGTKKSFIRQKKRQKFEDDILKNVSDIIHMLVQGVGSIYYKFVLGTSKNIQMPEVILLNLQEALYLVDQLKILEIYEKDKLLSSSTLWDRFCNIQGKEYFISRYICFHYYRGEGYIVKSGLKYGCDFVLYSKKIETVHAEFCILIIPSNMSWVDIQRQTRLTQTVAKTLKICKIYYPKEMNLSKLSECKIEEFLIKRVGISKKK